MAINNLSGNFQPLTTVSGRPLPQSNAQPNSELTPTSTVEINNTNSVVNIRAVASEVSNVEQEQTREQATEASEDIRAQVEELNSLTQSIQRRLSFQVDNDLGETIVSVFDRETDELIRQIPSDEVIALSKRLKELSEEATDVSSGIFIQREV